MTTITFKPDSEITHCFGLKDEFNNAASSALLIRPDHIVWGILIDDISGIPAKYSKAKFTTGLLLKDSKGILEISTDQLPRSTKFMGDLYYNSVEGFKADIKISGDAFIKIVDHIKFGGSPFVELHFDDNEEALETSTADGRLELWNEALRPRLEITGCEFKFKYQSNSESGFHNCE